MADVSTALRRRLARFARDRRGNVLMISAFALVPITFATGMAIDYSRAARLQAKADAAADAAALSGTAKPMMNQPMLAVCNAARRTFLSGVEQSVGGLTLDRSTNPRITITESYRSSGDVTFTCPTTDVLVPVGLATPVSRTVTVSYRATSNNAFGGVLNAKTIAIAGSATARSKLTDFIDIHMALDTSQSMGLAATDADAVKLWNATLARNGRGCQFGCHARDPKERYSMEEIARMPDVNARMRIDVLRDATIDAVDTAIANQGSDQKYRFALYRIGKNAGRWGPGTDQYVPLTTQLSTVKTKVSTLSLGENDGSVGFGDTDLGYTLNFVRPLMGATSAAVDDGSSQSAARKFFFLVTDGVSDVEGSGSNCTWGHCTAPINTAQCDAYKALGITIGIVYTTYLPVKGNPMNPYDTSLRPEYEYMVKPIADRIRSALVSCASPDWFFEASDGPGIHAAMQKLFKQAAESSRLSK